MNCDCYMNSEDYGPQPYVANVTQEAEKNENFRKAIWTGGNMQMTLMNIPPCGDIGVEMHKDTDQFIRVEQGNAMIKMGTAKNQLCFQRSISRGDVIFVPAGTWHNVINAGRCPLKVSSIYAPPNHTRGTVHRTKADAQMEEY